MLQPARKTQETSEPRETTRIFRNLEKREKIKEGFEPQSNGATEREREFGN